MRRFLLVFVMLFLPTTSFGQAVGGVVDTVVSQTPLTDEQFALKKLGEALNAYSASTSVYNAAMTSRNNVADKLAAAEIDYAIAKPNIPFADQLIIESALDSANASLVRANRRLTKAADLKAEAFTLYGAATLADDLGQYRNSAIISARSLVKSTAVRALGTDFATNDIGQVNIAVGFARTLIPDPE